MVFLNFNCPYLIIWTFHNPQQFVISLDISSFLQVAILPSLLSILSVQCRQIVDIPLLQPHGDDVELAVAASDNDGVILVSPLDISNDIADNVMDISAQITDKELEPSASYDHHSYGGHYHHPDDYHGGHHSQSSYHQPHTHSQSHSHSDHHSSSDDHDHYHHQHHNHHFSGLNILKVEHYLTHKIDRTPSSPFA